jgi:acyl carrier protein
MTLNEIEASVIAGLKQVQQISGRTWTDLTRSSEPIGELDGFDSLASIEATVVIEERLGCTIEHDSLFISDDGTRPLTVGQICERLAMLIGATGGPKR